MSTKKIRVSQQGLTRCPSCKAHIAVAPALKETTCPFCATSLLDALAAPPRAMERILGSGKSALIAASLLGMPALGACGDNGGDDTTPTDDAGTVDTGPDTQPIPPYGIPGPFDVEADASPIPDAPAEAPAYGIPSPADAFAGPDDVPDVFEEEEEDTSDGDASEDVEADTEKEDPTPVPLYGMPPNPSE